MVVEDERGWEHVGNPLKFEGEPPRLDFALPTLGQHSCDILRELGYADSAIADLVEAGTIIRPA